MTNFDHKKEWFYEGLISGNLVSYFKEKGFDVIKNNSDKINSSGEDIIVSKNGYFEIIEVKGYPSEYYTNGPNKGLKKTKTPGNLQATHGFADVIVSTIFNYQKHREKDDFTLGIALPMNDRYKELISKVEDFFIDHNIKLNIYFIDKTGRVEVRKLNQKK